MVIAGLVGAGLLRTIDYVAVTVTKKGFWHKNRGLLPIIMGMVFIW